MGAEEWRAVPGYGGRYEVSSLGRVRTHHRKAADGSPSIMHTKYRRSPRMEKGYPTVCFSLDNRTINKCVHHLVLEAFVGPRQGGQECRHLDGDSHNNHAENLAWGTQRENMEDRARHGRNHRGEKNGYSKLSRDSVIKLRLMRSETGAPYTEIAKAFGVSANTAWAVATHRRWKHISAEAALAGGGS